MVLVWRQLSYIPDVPLALVQGFFRRMLKEQLHKKFICTNGENCEIASTNRTNCKFCRFSKCLHVGMTLEGWCTVCFSYLTAFSRTAWVSQHQKGKPFWISVEQEMMSDTLHLWARCPMCAIICLHRSSMIHSSRDMQAQCHDTISNAES